MSRAIDQIKKIDAEHQEKQHQQILKIQKECKHAEVGHWGGNYDNNPGSSSITYPIRICLNCGLEEEGSWWSYSGIVWSRKNFERPVLGKAKHRTFTPFSFDEFLKHRI